MESRIELNKKQTKHKLEKFKQNDMRDTSEEKFYKVINRMLPYMNTEDSILDIGCRGGIFFDKLKEFGFTKLYGTEILQEGVNIAKNKEYGAELSDIQEEYLDMKFDIIFMAHVLEHTSNPSKSISNVYNMLNDGGVLYIEVPRREEGKDNDYSHFYQFNNFNKLNNLFDDRWELLGYQDDFPVIGIYKNGGNNE